MDHFDINFTHSHLHGKEIHDNITLLQHAVEDDDGKENVTSDPSTEREVSRTVER